MADMGIKQPDKPGKVVIVKAPTWKVQVGVLPATEENSDVIISVEPLDAEKYSMRPTPAQFMCEDGVTYNFIAPKALGYAKFRHWRNPRTDEVLSESNELKLSFTRNDRLMAVYDRSVPCDVVIESVKPKNGVMVTASKPDISGRTQIKTPGNFTYLSGTDVTFSVDQEVVRKDRSPLRKVADEKYVFQGWRKGVNWISHASALDHQVERHGETIQVAYSHTPPPWSPGEVQLQSMGQQLKFAVQAKEPSDDIIILWDNQPVRAFNQFLFKSESVARAVARRLFMVNYKDWQARLPEDQAKWASVRENMEAFMEHWLENSLKFVRYSTFTAELNEAKKLRTETKLLKAQVAKAKG